MDSMVKASKELAQILRLRTQPIGIQFCESAAQLEGVPGLARPGHTAAICQLIGLARYAGETIGMLAADVMGGTPDVTPGNCASIFGLAPPVEFIASGAMLAGGCYKTLEDSRAEQDAILRVPAGRYEAVILAPVGTEGVAPDVVAFYGTPGQVMMLMNGLQWQNYAPVTMRYVGESSCSDGIIQCLLSGQPAGTVPCVGERQRGGAADDEMMMALPPEAVESTLAGVKSWTGVGIGYPVLPFGTQCDPASPPAVNVYHVPGEKTT